MAIASSIKVYPSVEMTHQDFALTMDRISVIQSGIVYGCVAGVSGSSTVTITEGWCIVRGRIVKIDAGSIGVTLTTSGTATRYLLLTVDLANSDTPTTVTVSSTSPSDDEDFNVNNGVAYLSLATITVTTSDITVTQNTGSGTVLSTTLAAASWSGSDGSATYTISDDRITASSNQEVLPAVGITTNQLSALQRANIQDGGQSAGTMILKSYGTTPTVDIPIRVIFRGAL